jgi:magnesium-transporting ATPase (P-type)
MMMVLLENVHVFNSRSETKSAFGLSPLRNPFLIGGVLLAQLLHISMLYLPLGQKVLSTEPVTIHQWLLLLLLALVLLVAMELHKAVWYVRTQAQRT